LSRSGRSPACWTESTEDHVRRSRRAQARVHLHGSYPTSTSSGSGVENRRVCGGEEPIPTPIDASERPLSGRVPQAHSGPDELAREARALLRLAALREEIPAERARAFAAAVLAESDVGRWALAVLRGEPHAARALVELAVQRVGVVPVATKDCSLVAYPSSKADLRRQ
jgi:hypothetical protein